MNTKIDDIIDAIHFISSDPALESEAFLSLSSGEIHCRSPYTEDYETVPDDIGDETKYLPLPHKNDLDLGVALVFEFVAELYPSAEDEVRAMFRKRGAYSRFKDWAERNDLLDDWYRFEEESTFEAVAQWCRDNDISFLNLTNP
jgi:hypothetical protein